ncbi:small acid-soluble spore protein alpha/beta type [Scopulibacillus darangshiensis]|uniref:Small acid-soluble spore protein alpha/beta type n=1 Tax=Scopulibacillus darangshiensis TaxID=442528 RepID=A0A4R2P8H2_9BACL|nr:alpha/beta-type small acid-soluble spore protein [Scopulibacillus darangshiensis]TCP30608.1 small acid-soluble spore protein alpha/beta type [Scopulibacillus darangshiensis]
MGNNNHYLVPEAKEGMQKLKEKVMAEQGYNVNPEQPNDVKYEVAEEVGVPLKKGYNGDMTAKEAGKIGGNIGGNMVKEMIQMAEQSLTNKK